MTRLGLFTGALLSGAALLAGACDEKQPETGLFSDAGELRGGTIAVLSLAGAPALQTRYVLQEGYGLDVTQPSGDLTFVEASPESLPELLSEGKVDAVVASQASAFELLQDERFAVLSHLSQEMSGITGEPVLSSVLVTYADFTEQQPELLIELNRMLSESMTYLRANRQDLIEAVASEEDIEADFLAWWWERHDVFFGETDVDVAGPLDAVWEASRAVGDIAEHPDPRTLALDLGAAPQAGQGGPVRTTLSIALLDEPGRRAALYAIERGLVTSDLLDLDVTYLPQSSLTEAVATKQYAVVETTPLAIAGPPESAATLRVLSPGLVDLDGTFLFIRSGETGD